MLTIEGFEKTFISIVEESEKDVEELINKYEDHLKDTPWPMGISKEFITKGLQALIDAEVPPEAMNPLQMMMEVMEGKTLKMPELSEKKKELMKKLQSLVNEAKTVECEHKNLVIAPFLHGGGFTPILAMPELICLDCGLNVTLFALRKGVENPSKVYEEKFGLTIVDKDGVKKLFAWVGNGDEYGGRHSLKNVEFSDNISRDPKGNYEKSENKWTDPIPFKIVDKKILEELSGS